MSAGEGGADGRGVAGLVLAAGAGRRLGAPKADLVVGGRPLLDRAVAALREGGAGPVVAVVQPGTAASSVACGSLLHDRAGDGGGEPLAVENPDWESGMGSSLRAGLAALPACDAVVVTLVDTPRVGAGHVRRLLAAHAAGARAAVAAYDGAWRTPVLLGHEHWAEVARLAVGDVGARPFLRLRADLVVPVECGDLGPWTDVDTPEDLAAVRRGDRG